MIFSPEAGYKFEIEVELNCSASNEELWRLVFVLQKRIDGKFEKLVEIKYQSKDAKEAEGIAAISDRGLTRTQARIAREKVFPKTKPLADEGRNATPEESTAIKGATRELIVVDL
jgi:hypothetical protein